MLDGPCPMKSDVKKEKVDAGDDDRWSAVWITIKQLLSFRDLFVLATAMWLWQSFLWGGLYLGCGLTVGAVLATLAGLIVRDYVSTGTVGSRYAAPPTKGFQLTVSTAARMKAQMFAVQRRLYFREW